MVAQRAATYYQLAKPGIIRGNLLTASAGYFLASAGHVDWWRLLGLLTGMSLVIGCAAVYNNLLDRDIDALMARTKNRPLVTKKIKPRSALLYGTVLGITGFSILILKTNALTVLIGVLGLVTYVGLYGIGKRRSPYGTHLGTISGSLPPVAGYTAVTGRLDLTSGLLFLILVFWQMAHFFSIALYRQADYAAARIPVWPIPHGTASTKKQIILFIILFGATTLLLTVTTPLSWLYALIMLLVTAYWLINGWRTWSTKPPEQWGKTMFLISLLAITTWSIAVVTEALA